MTENNFLVLSDDGSHTIIHPEYEVPYHSRRGAIKESEVVFINSCLSPLGEKGNIPLHIFEMGFGSGLNAFLTCLWAESHQQEIHYTGIEAFPLEDTVYTQLNYPDLLGNHETFLSLHTVEWNQKCQLGDYFHIMKIHKKIEIYNPENLFDGIYYDAFAPTTQPECWDETAAQRLFDWLCPGGIVTTYCAQGQFRRNLVGAGFTVERLPGPPGKREMLRATKP